MAVKIVSKEILEEIRETLGLSYFARPFSGIIDPGDFGTVATYLPIFSDEYQKLPPRLQAHTYLVGEKRYGLISFLPRTFEAPDKGKVISVTKQINAWEKIIKVSYKTDIGGEFETEHDIRREKLYKYAKNKKLHINVSVKISS